jgi:hypothetical protein
VRQQTKNLSEPIPTAEKDRGSPEMNYLEKKQ